MYTVHVTIFDMQLYGDDVASPPSCQVRPPKPHAVPDLRDLPWEPQGVLACCNPIPTLLRQQLTKVYVLVQQARETPPSGKV